MRKIIFILFVLTACSTVPPKLPTISTGHKVQKRLYYEVQGAGDILRNTEHATIAAWIRPHAIAESNEDIFNISVGGKPPQWKTRAGFRVMKNGAFQSVARADDSDELSEITTTENLERANEWQHVALTINYANKVMEFYIDGKSAHTSQALFRFTKLKTSDTPSANVTLGSEDDGKSAYFNGEIAGAFVEKRILSPDEILNLMKATHP